MAEKILVVDDDREMVELIELFLSNAGFLTLSAYSGEEALEKTFKEKPDLILLDIMMPKIDGWEVLRRIKNDPEVQNTPVAFITARTQNIDKMIGLSVMKAAGYITKPFSKQELLTEVRRILAETKRDPGA
ncbi:MAG: DNA-binding response regulator [Actinobacteria bacterium]|nr:MAG: DNA-binding response regulator [Actinomycetota bacterium]